MRNAANQTYVLTDAKVIMSKYVFQSGIIPTVAGLLLSLNAVAEQNMSHEAYKAEKSRIESEYKVDKARCDSLAKNAKDVCQAEAKGKEDVGKADLEARYKPSERKSLQGACSEGRS